MSLWMLRPCREGQQQGCSPQGGTDFAFPALNVKGLAERYCFFEWNRNTRFRLIHSKDFSGFPLSRSPQLLRSISFLSLPLVHHLCFGSLLNTLALSLVCWRSLLFAVVAAVQRQPFPPPTKKPPQRRRASCRRKRSSVSRAALLPKVISKTA